MIPNIREHMLHMREEEEFRDSSRTKKSSRLVSKKRHEREQNFILFSLWRESLSFAFSRHRSRIIRSSVVVYYYSVVVSRKRGTLRSSFLSEKEGERGAKKKNWI